MELYSLLVELLGKYGPSGDEGDIARCIIDKATPLCDEVTTDVMGNVIAHKKGSGKKLMFSAHMDSIGLVATHIEDEGFIRVGNIGGVDPKEVLYSVVSFKNGTKGIIVKEEKTLYGKLKISNLLIDIGAKSKEEAMEQVMTGDVCVITVPPVQIGSKQPSIVAPYLDNRVACAVLLLTLEQLQGKTVENDLYFVFSTQEEVGLRGAKPVSYAIDPQYGIAVDVTDVCDNPDSEKNGTTSLGKGAGIKIMDRSVISHPEVVKILETLAKEQNIPHQRDIMKAGGTDAGVMHLSRGGVKTSGISIPCRYVHCPTEMADLGDIQACVDLSLALSLYPLQ